MITITEKDIVQIGQPIRDYINNNNVTRNDIPVIVLNHFPSDERVMQLAIFLRNNVQQLSALRHDKLLDRTRQILQAQLVHYGEEVLNAKLHSSDDDDGHEYCEYEDIHDEILYNQYGDFEFSDSELPNED